MHYLVTYNSLQIVYIRKEYLIPNRAFGWVSRVFASYPSDRGSIPDRVIPKSQKMVLDAALLNAQHYKVRIKSKVEQFREWSGTFPYAFVY